MWTTAGIIAASFAMLAMDGPRLWRMRSKRDFIIFTAILLLATGLSIVNFATNVQMPNLSYVLVIVYKPVHHIISSLLK
jgi:hypothetical protein